MVAQAFVAQRVTVPRGATYMSPALTPGARVWLDKLSPRIAPLHRGDIVAVVIPGEDNFEERTVFLRIVGLPGETIAVKDGRLVAGGAPVGESYAHGKIPFTFLPVRIRPGEYFVLADDRAAYPSNGGQEPIFWGVVSRRSIPVIIGRVSPTGR